MGNQSNHNRRRRRKEYEGDLASTLGMGRMLRDFVQSLQVRNYSANTTDSRRKHGNDFIVWAEQRSLTLVDQITRPIL